MDEPRILKRDDPEDVFALLSDDGRVEILQALWTADDPVAFSELHETVSIRDSGQFNYHLDKLLGRFVRKTPDGYELTQAGKAINGAIEAGAYTLEASFEPIDLEDPCPACGGVRTLAYEDEVINIECESCEIGYHFVVPPGAFAGYDRAAIPHVASRYLRATFQHIKSGFCSFCEGRTAPTIEIDGTPAETTGEDGDDDAGAIPIVHYDCERCGHTATAGLWMAASDHPAVRSFYHEHGVDLRDRPAWAFPALDPDHLNVRSRDPLRASVTYAVDGETLTVVLDGDAEVVETNV